MSNKFTLDGWQDRDYFYTGFGQPNRKAKIVSDTFRGDQLLVVVTGSEENINNQYTVTLPRSGSSYSVGFLTDAPEESEIFVNVYGIYVDKYGVYEGGFAVAHKTLKDATSCASDALTVCIKLKFLGDKFIGAEEVSL